MNDLSLAKLLGQRRRRRQWQKRQFVRAERNRETEYGLQKRKENRKRIRKSFENNYNETSRLIC